MISDLRLIVRSLGKSPGFCVVAILTLAFGIGVNTGTFSIVNAIALRGLPYPEAKRLLLIETARPAAGDRHSQVSQQEFIDLRARQKSFEDVSAFTEGSFMLSAPGTDAERVNACTLAGPGAAMLRVPATLGRWFNADEDKPGAAGTIVIGDTLWRDRFHSDQAIIGQQVKVDGEWSTIVGVAPRDFSFPARAVMWKPWRFVPSPHQTGVRRLTIFGRLKSGVTAAQGQAELSAIAQSWAVEHPKSNKGVVLTVRSLSDFYVDETTRQLLGVMLGSVFFVLLLACANVANLLLARAVVRQREISIRVALGASRTRIVQLLLLEAVVLASAGGVVGWLLAAAQLASFRRDMAPLLPPVWMTPTLDWASLVYIFVATGATCLLAGLFPAWRMSRPDLNAVLKDGGQGATGVSVSRFTRVLVVCEVAISCVMLVLAALATLTVIRVESAPLGYETAGIFTNRIDLPGRTYAEPAKSREFYRELLARLMARSEVEAVAISSTQPTWAPREQVEFEGRPRGGSDSSGPPAQFAARAAVSENYFATLGIRLAQGRTFEEHDTTAAPKVAVISTRFAERFWPGENPLGKRFVFGRGLNVRREDWLDVIGVVAPTIQGDYNNDTANLPQAYVPYTQADNERNMTVFTKAHPGQSAAALAPVVRAAVRSLDEDQPIFWPQTLEQMVDQAKYSKKLFARIFSFLGLSALLLAMVGLFGVMSYAVSQRTQEIGVRMALGAQSGDVLRLVLKQGAWQIGLGLAAGLPAAYFGGQLLRAILYAVEPGDPLTFGAALLVLIAAGFGACLVPALRAARVNPLEALRRG